MDEGIHTTPRFLLEMLHIKIITCHCIRNPVTSTVLSCVNPLAVLSWVKSNGEGVYTGRVSVGWPQ